MRSRAIESYPSPSTERFAAAAAMVPPVWLPNSPQAEMAPVSVAAFLPPGDPGVAHSDARTSVHRRRDASVRRPGPTLVTDEADVTPSPPRVLVVDDEPMLANLVRHVLEREYDVTVAHSGTDALERILFNEAFDVVLCDVRLPGLTGRELLEAVRDAAPEQAARFVFMSGGLEDPEADFVRDNGLVLVQKPFGIGQLRRLVADVARRSTRA